MMNTPVPSEDFSLEVSYVAPTEGRKDDTNKCRIELVPAEMIFAVATILGDACQEGGKYPERNWEKGMKWSRVFGALMRHMWAWWAGRAPTPHSFCFGILDPETNRSHLWHAACCMAFLVTYEERAVGTDDRYKG